MSNAELEETMNAYTEHSDMVNARIDSLLPGYGISAADVELDAHATINEQIIRVTLGSLAKSSQELGPAEELHTLKRDTLIKLLGEDRIAIDSPWVDLINDFVMPEKPVTFDADVFAAIAATRKEAEATRVLVRQDIEQWYEDIAPEQRETLQDDSGE